MAYFDQVKKSDLNSNGLLATETASSDLSADDAPTCGIAPVIHYDVSGIKSTTLKGQLYFIDQTPDNKGVIDYSEKTNVHSNVSIGAFRNGSLLAAGNLYTNGIYTIPNVPVNPDSSYPVTIKFDDTLNLFNDDSIDVLIPSNAGSEISTGRTQLLTKDGKVCSHTDAACISNQVSKYGEVKVAVFNSETGAPLPGVDVDLRYGASLSGPLVKTHTTDADGIATFKDVEYGKYNAYVNNSDYVNGYSAITVQSHKNSSIISVNPKDSRYDLTLNYIPTNTAADLDYKLYVRNKAGTECEVSPLNKYCAYARHARDAAPGGDDFETIQIKDFAVAKYKTTVEPSPAYSGSCSQLDATKIHAQSANSWNWNTFKTNTPLTKIALQFSQIFNESKGVGNTAQKINNLLGLISDKVPVETPAQAAVPKFLLNKGGKKMKEEFLESTFINPRGKEIESRRNYPKDTYDSTLPIGPIKNPSVKPAETKPAETKPAETKPAETKPVEEKPTETKPVEEKPVEEKPVEEKPVEEKPAESVPVEQPKTGKVTGSFKTATNRGRILQEPLAVNESPNYLIVDCFTGFGKPSFVKIFEYVASQSALKSWAWCDNTISSAYSLDALETANKNAK